MVMAGDPEFEPLLGRCAFPEVPVSEARRAVVLVEVERIADSCGYGVPVMRFEALRPHHEAWAAKRIRVAGNGALRDYQREKNELSIDGLPAVEVAATEPEVAATEPEVAATEPGARPNRL
jgi:hypothetical protein